MIKNNLVVHHENSVKQKFNTVDGIINVLVVWYVPAKLLPKLTWIS